MRHRDIRLAFLLLALTATVNCGAQTGLSIEDRSSTYLESVRHDPVLLREFLYGMPKGGDLHNHLEGSVYAESFVRFASGDGLCANRRTYTLTAPPCAPAAERFLVSKRLLEDFALKEAMIDAYSMRNWAPGSDSAHEHFFQSFSKFSEAAKRHTADMMAEVIARAGEEHLQYLEIMCTPDGGRAIKLGSDLPWNNDFAKTKELLTAGISILVQSTRKSLDDAENQVQTQLKCGTPRAARGCGVSTRYIYQVLRGFAPNQVFAQMLLAFQLAEMDSRVVGVNLVMPEDWYVPLKDFDLHMKMLAYLHELHPKVHIALHAGELWSGLVAPEELRFHIRKSIEKGAAERIGHGTSVMFEDHPIELLKEMAAKKILVEICLTSNDLILGVRGVSHPLPLYLKYGVPAALATDDQGVSRSDITAEYVRATQAYLLTYRQLKQFARESLEHSFLSGVSLWADLQLTSTVPACASDRRGASSPSDSCRSILDKSARARLQWKLESEFEDFEQTVSSRVP